MEDPDAASPQPAMDDPAAASLHAAMEVPITASLGPTGPLLRKLHSLMAPEHGLPDWLTVDDQIHLLRDGLKVLCISLKNLSEAEDASFTAKWWMKIVRELCYDTEDHLDEVMFSVAGGAHQIAYEFSELIARVEDASERRKHFQWSPKTVKPDCGEAGVSGLTPQLSLELPVPIPVHVNTGGCSIVGVEDPMNKLVDLLAFNDDNKKELKVVPIFGFAGVGKTTVARTLYHKYGGKFQCRAFLRVSRNPDMRRLLTSMLSQIKAPRPHGFPDMTDLIDGIRKHLQGKRYFIIMDDLWTASAWDIISRAFPHGDYCSRIITTTQIDDVAMASCSYYSEHIYKMSPLNEDESRKLFFGRVFGSEDGCPTDIKEVSYKIIRKCGGLPLAIVNIASLLASEPNIIREKWKHVQDSVSSTSEGMKDILNVIYNSLPPRLKTCLLYLSMYPEGYPIGKHDLVKQWIAEGFLSAVEGGDTDELAEGYFDELVSRGMIQAVDVNYNGDVLSCTVHHIVLDLIRWKSMEDNFIIIADNFQSIVGLPDKVRRLSIQFGGAKCAKIPESIVISHVRSLIFSGFIKCVPPIVDCRFLRVLALHIWVDQGKTSFDLSRIHQLFQLRYLKIECNVKIKLPAKIRRLQYLGTLEVDARLSVVPSDIVHSQSLVHLYLPSQAHLPAGIGHMTSLRSLGYFNLSNNSRENVLGLGKLINLWDLRLTCSTIPSGRLIRNIEHLGSILGELSKLKSLILDAGASSLNISCDGLNSVSPAPALLERLELPWLCIFPSLPRWFGELRRLCILMIAVREPSREDIAILEGLPALTALSLYVWTASVRRIVFGEGFRALRYFKFTCAAPCLTFEKDAMPNIQRLKLRFNANGLEQYNPVRTGFEHLLGLKEISAKIGSVGADEYDSIAALWMNVFSKLPSSPIFNMQLVDRIFNGNRKKSSARNEEKHRTTETVQDAGVEVRSDEQYVIQGFAAEGTSKQAEADSGTSVASGSSLQIQILGEESKATHTGSALEAPSSKHPSTPHNVNREFTESIINDDKKTSSTTKEEKHFTPEIKDVISEERSDKQREDMNRQADSMSSTPSGYIAHLQDSDYTPQYKEGHDQLRNKATNTEPGSVQVATGAMGSLLPKLAELLQEQYKLPTAIKEDVESLSRELTSMEVTLSKIAEVPWDQLDKHIRLWVDNVRELSYKMEDVIDNFMVRVEGFEPTVDPDTFKGFMKKVTKLFKKVAKLLKKGKTHHQITDVIKDIKAQVQEVAARRDKYKVDYVRANPAATDTVDPRLLALFKDQRQLIGIEGPREELIERLIGGDDGVSEQQLKILSISGMGGLGKTTLAKAVYNKLQAQFECTAFVPMGQDPSSKKVLMDILHELDEDSYLNARMLDERQLIEKLRRLLKNKRYLIVIDDIWDESSWEIIRCAWIDSNYGSRIIITTRIFEIAKVAGDVYKQKTLSPSTSKELFYTRLSIDKCKVSYDQSVEISEKILWKCGGVPLAIITIASLLASKPMEDWSDVYDSIGFGCGDNKLVDNMRKILLYSYYDLPCYLKTCLLHLSIFPEDFVIPKDTLIWKWVAEAFVHEKPGVGLFELGERYFNELINRSMIQPIEWDKGMVYACRVHGLVLDMIYSLSKQENFVVVLGSNEQHTYPQSNARRLAVQKRVIDQDDPMVNTSMPQVRSFSFTMCHINMMPSLLCFQCLRVLALEGCIFMEDRLYHLEHLGRLLQLRYLELSMMPITELPSEIGDLRFLQTLVLYETRIKELPRSVGLLRQLKVLRLPICFTGVLDWIGQLTSLEELWLPYVSQNFVKELGKLTELRSFAISSRYTSTTAQLFNDLMKSLYNLQKLQVINGRFERASCIEWSSEGYVPPRHLRRLVLCNVIFPRLPSWMDSSRLPHLSCLELEVDAILEAQDVEILGRFPELVSLQLESRGDIFPVIVGGGAFPKLRWFYVNRELRFLQGAMPRLEYVGYTIRRQGCKTANLNGDFASIGYLPCLQKVDIRIRYASESDLEEAKAALRHAIEVHPNRPKLELFPCFVASEASSSKETH